MPATDPLAGLYDIEGLDTIGIWPLAIGWWVLLAIVLALIAIGTVLYLRKRAMARSWRKATLQTLDRIAQDAPSQQSAAILSELIRRIAMQTHTRKTCAGLEGKAWLAWLTQHDPKAFNWTENATWLLDLPYAPSTAQIPISHIKKTIDAIRGWI